MTVKRVAILTAGGIAPCLSSSIGCLIQRYTQMPPEIEILCYRYGYRGLLLGDSIAVTPAIREAAGNLLQHGGSAIGNSRIKLTNVENCVKRGLIQAGQHPLEVAAKQLTKDGVDVLHTIGGDDTNTTAADLARYLKQNKYPLTVVGLPKTIDNDVFPISQTLGAATAAEQTAHFFENVCNEYSASNRMLIIHEVMGRNCGWLTAESARRYTEGLDKLTFVPELGPHRDHKAIHAIYIPELKLDLQAEAKRLSAKMETNRGVNIFMSEGAGLEDIVREMEAAGEEVPRDAFGHVRLDDINPGQWFGKRFAELIGAEKVLVQKSGYFARSARPNTEDLLLIQSCAETAVACALAGESGVVGHDEDHQNTLRAIEFDRIKGGKPFNADVPWFTTLLENIEQPFTIAN